MQYGAISHHGHTTRSDISPRRYNTERYLTTEIQYGAISHHGEAIRGDISPRRGDTEQYLTLEIRYGAISHHGDAIRSDISPRAHHHPSKDQERDGKDSVLGLQPWTKKTTRRGIWRTPFWPKVRKAQFSFQGNTPFHLVRALGRNLPPGKHFPQLSPGGLSCEEPHHCPSKTLGFFHSGKSPPGSEPTGSRPYTYRLG